ncbi:hypothetical protein RCS94_06395 [Orbaceae bacterium ac157xtp]
MLAISTEKKKEQSFKVNLNGQHCMISLSQKDTGLYLSLHVDEKPVVLNVLCLNTVKLIRYKYLGFLGDLFFYDTQGDDKPSYDGLNDRFLLYYKEEE